MQTTGNGWVRWAALAASLALVVPAVATAQSVVSVWAGAGGAGAPEGDTMGHGRNAKQLGVQLSLPFTPLALRGDALLLGPRLDRDAISYSVNAVFPLRLPLLQPYGIIGRGRYARPPLTKVSGWNYGAGVRVGLSRLGLFGELRRHDALGRTVTVVGLTF